MLASYLITLISSLDNYFLLMIFIAYLSFETFANFRPSKTVEK